MKALLCGLTLLLSLNAIANELSDYQVMSIPKGTKVVFKTPIEFLAGTVGGRLGDNTYVSLGIQQENYRILNPRTCVIESISGEFSGWLNVYNYNFKLSGGKDKICESIKLKALMFLSSSTGETINSEFQKYGIELVTPDPIHL